MNIESLGVVYHLSKEDVIEAVDRYLEALGQQFYT